MRPSKRDAAKRSRLLVFPSLRSYRETVRFGALFRTEAFGGALLVTMAVIAIAWANSPVAESYFALRDFRIGVANWGLELSIGQWATDGLLAIFFFLVGLELKREFVTGDLRQIRTAVVPIAAAFGGVAVPAVIFLLTVGADETLRRGWAIPTATDIAFAIAVLALVGSHLPSPLRIFLLTLAVMDDLIAIGIIAVFYTDEINLTALLLAALTIVVYGLIAQLSRRFFGLRPLAAWLILLPIGVLAWAFMHASGIHATIAGVLLAFTVPVLHKKAARFELAGPGLAEQFEYRFRPLSAVVAVPIFAFFAAGVSIGGFDQLLFSLTDPLAVAIIAALVVGKPVGILSMTWVLSKVARMRLDPALRWLDLAGVSILAGIGFTVSLLVAELSFSSDGAEHNVAKVGIFAGSVIAALLAMIVLGLRNRRYRNRRYVSDARGLNGVGEK